MSVDDAQVSFSMEINVEPTMVEIRRLEALLYRSLSLMRRFGLPDEISAAIIKVQGLIRMLNTLRLTMAMLSLQAGPVGWALAAVGFASGVLTAGDMMFEQRGYV